MGKSESKHAEKTVTTPKTKATTTPEAGKKQECAICIEEKNAKEFPGKITAQCGHARDVCRTCVARTCDLEVNGKGNSTRIPCPHAGCDEVLSHADVQREATKEVFTRFDELLLREWLLQEPNFRWCAHAGCGSGQIHVGRIGRDVNMRCHHCSQRTCTHHRCPAHTGRTCTQYDRDAGASEEVALLQYLEREGTIRCPTCNHGIEKKSGCDHMTCDKKASGCGAQFCFRCQADYMGPQGIRARGNQAHKPGCPHYRPPPAPARLEEEE